jgi:hypothetical protein
VLHLEVHEVYLLLLLPAVLISISLLSRIALCKLLTVPVTPDQSILLHNVGIIALELLGLGFGFFALGSLTSTLWIWTGLKTVYKAVAEKDMVWLDTKIHAGGSVQRTRPWWSRCWVGHGCVVGVSDRHQQPPDVHTPVKNSHQGQSRRRCVLSLVNDSAPSSTIP